MILVTVPVRQSSDCDKLSQACEEHDFGLKGFEMSMLTQLCPVDLLQSTKQTETKPNETKQFYNYINL